MKRKSLERGFLVTGASSGLGRAFALRLAPSATRLLLSGRDPGRLEESAELARAAGAGEVETALHDLATPGAGRELARIVEEKLGPAPGLVLNAGFSLSAEAWRVAAEPAHAELQVNARSILDLLVALGPGLRLAGDGLVLLVSSIAGAAGIPGQSGYASAKAFTLSLGQALHHEFKDEGITLATYEAGLLDTAFFATNGIDRDRRWARIGRFCSPDEAARRALEGLSRGRMLISHGFQNRLLLFLHRILSREWVSGLNRWAMGS